MWRLFIVALGFMNVVQAQESGSLRNLNLSPGAKLFKIASDDHELFPRFMGKMMALVQVSDTNSGFGEKIEVLTRAGHIWTVQFLPEDAGELFSSDNAGYIDIAWRVNSPRKLNDSARVHSGVQRIHNGEISGMPFYGSNVVVGVVDVGFQPDNPTFYNRTGAQYRVKNWWQQALTTGTPPVGFTYGSEQSAENSILATRDDDGTHGTHVAGIAAGSGYTTQGNSLRGMAPDADIIFVTIRYSNDSLAGSALGDKIVANPAIIDGYNYVFQKATQMGKPCVINLSWGMHIGPHDGTSLFDKAVESLSGKGKIICGSAGNDGGNAMHISADLKGDTVYSVAMDRSRDPSRHENVCVDIWGAKSTVLSANVSLYDTLGNAILQTPFFTSGSGPMHKRLFHVPGDSLWVTFSANPSYINNQKPEILLIAESSNAAKHRIRFGISGTGVFHAWNSGAAYQWTSGTFTDKVYKTTVAGKNLNGTSEYSIVENGGTGKATITSGSYVSRKQWYDVDTVFRSHNWLKTGEASGFSSRGPLPDGRLKPDISAPGQNVASSVNYRTYAPWMSEITLVKTDFNSQKQPWVLFSGTSMASPHTAGIVALMLEQNPLLDAEHVKGILRHTALRDSFTGPDSNVHYGFGKIHAYDAVIKTKMDASISQPGWVITVFPNPADERVHIVNPAMTHTSAQYSIYNALGMRVATGKLMNTSSGASELNTSALKDGLYVLELTVNSSKKSTFVLIRH